LKFKAHSHLSREDEHNFEHFISFIKDHSTFSLNWSVVARIEAIAHEFKQLVLAIPLGLEELAEAMHHVIKHVVNNQSAFKLHRKPL